MASSFAVEGIDQETTKEGIMTVEAWIIIMDILEVPFIIKDTGLVVEYTKEGTGFVGAFIEVVNLEVPFIIKDTGLAVEYIK